MRKARPGQTWTVSFTYPAGSSIVTYTAPVLYVNGIVSPIVISSDTTLQGKIVCSCFLAGVDVGDTVELRGGSVVHTTGTTLIFTDIEPVENLIHEEFEDRGFVLVSAAVPITIRVRNTTTNTYVNGAKVSIYSGSERRTGYTNGSGILSISVPSGSTTIAVYYPSAIHTPLVVNVQPGQSQIEIDITTYAFEPPQLTIAHADVLFNEDEGSALFSFKVINPNSTSTPGISWSMNNFTVIVYPDNPVLNVPLYKNAQYQVKRNDGAWVSFTTDNDDLYILPEING